MTVEELQTIGLVGGDQHLQEQPPKRAATEHRTGRKKPGLHDTHVVPSSEMPPPGTIMCTCG